MTDHPQELLATLKKISEWADLQKKVTKWSLLSLIPLGIILIATSLYFDRTIKEISSDESKPAEWYDVTLAERKGDLGKALSIADELLARTPLDFEGHYRKGELLLELGRRDAALESFKKAKEIFPIPKHNDAVEALDK